MKVKQQPDHIGPCSIGKKFEFYFKWVPPGFLHTLDHAIASAQYPFPLPSGTKTTQPSLNTAGHCSPSLSLLLRVLKKEVTKTQKDVVAWPRSNNKWKSQE